tara:strand:+ start:2083 stop:2556 length:474 start_codon:yes stop_codon:yes gene_type:complete
MVKSLSIFLIFLVSIFVGADLPPITKEAFERNSNKLLLDDNAQIITVSANKYGITKSNLVVGKPSLNTLQNIRLLSPKDKYALKILNSDKEEIFLIGIGDPFYIHAQHIGYENEDFFGGYIDVDLKIALPFDTDVSYLILMSHDNKLLKKIDQIKVK